MTDNTFDIRSRRGCFRNKCDKLDIIPSFIHHRWQTPALSITTHQTWLCRHAGLWVAKYQSAAWNWQGNPPDKKKTPLHGALVSTFYGWQMAVHAGEPQRGNCVSFLRAVLRAIIFFIYF